MILLHSPTTVTMSVREMFIEAEREQTEGVPVQTKNISTKQEALQPSPLTLLASSQVSPTEMVPSPQTIASHSREDELRKYPEWQVEHAVRLAQIKH